MHLRAFLVAALVLGSLFALPAAAEPPVITGVTPASGAPGDRFQVNGTGFDNSTSVTLGGVAVEHVVKNSTIYAVVPNLTAGMYDVEVSDDEGNSTWCCFEVVEAAPAVDGFDPWQGRAGTWVWVWGRHLDLVTAVEIAGHGAAFHSGSTWLEFEIPNGTPVGFHNFQLYHPNGVLHVCCFEVVDPDRPIIHYLAPNLAAPYDRVSIQGENLDNIHTLLLWGSTGGTRLDVFWRSPWTIMFDVPDVPFGEYHVVAYYDLNQTTESVWTCCLTIDPSLPRADLAVDVVSVEKSTIRTDFTDPVTHPLGTQTITVRVDNVGDADARPAHLQVGVVQDGLGYDATWWHVETPRLAPGESVVYTFEWEPGDVVGDAKAVARFDAWAETGNPSNDQDEEDTFVLVGGLGSANVPLAP